MTIDWNLAIAILIAVASEVMGANPHWRYNGILDAVIKLLKRR